MSGCYSLSAVRAALPAIWDDHYGAGLEESPAGMYRHSRTRVTSDASASTSRCTAWAVGADLRRAWRRTQMTESQRRAMVLVGGLRCTYVEAGHVLGVAPNTVQVNFERGLAHLQRCLQASDARHTA